MNLPPRFIRPIFPLLFATVPVLLIPAMMEAQRVSSLSPRLTPAKNATLPEEAGLPFDTLRTIPPGAISFAGYDKQLRASRESIFISNHMEADSVVEVVWFSVRYLDSAGRELHQRSQRVAVSIPPGGTRKVDFPSWDTQRSFYFYQNPPARSSAIPYSVTVAPDSLVISREAF